jgi:hypothetical protein
VDEDAERSVAPALDALVQDALFLLRHSLAQVAESDVAAELYTRAADRFAAQSCAAQAAAAEPRPQA